VAEVEFSDEREETFAFGAGSFMAAPDARLTLPALSGDAPLPGETLCSLHLRHLQPVRVGPAVATATVRSGLGRMELRDSGRDGRRFRHGDHQSLLIRGRQLARITISFYGCFTHTCENKILTWLPQE
jgi:hypothetical protein